MAKRILIADDSVTIQRAFAMTLAGEDLSLVSARSAEEGLSLAQRGRPDLVIADSVMTGGTGYDLCQAIKSDPSLRGVPVYILTSLHNPFDDARARQVGADGQFVKPFESLSLVAGITEALAKGTTAGPVAPARAVAPAAPPPSVSVLDDYGEISVSGPSPAANNVESVAPVRPAPVPAAAPAPASTMRPSLIPGLRPGVAPARPGAAPVRSPGMPGPAPGPAPVSPFPPAVRGPAPQPPAAPMRTMMGLPAAGLQPPPRTAVPGGTLPPAARPVAAPGLVAPPVTGLGAQVAASVASRVAERMAAVSARGPEYEAVAKLSKEIIEKIAWEIVPELAEAIIREELQKRGRI
jgi:CheY-like chemotaxis protein